MKQELRRVDPLRAANIGALVYGLLMGAFALLFLPFVLVMSAVAPSDEFGIFGLFFFVFLLLIYPVIGLVMGWIGTLLTAAIYNLVIRWTGGLLFEFDSVPPGSSSGVA